MGCPSCTIFTTLIIRLSSLTLDSTRHPFHLLICVYNDYTSGLFYTKHASELLFIRYLIKHNTLVKYSDSTSTTKSSKTPMANRKQTVSFISRDLAFLLLLGSQCFSFHLWLGSQCFSFMEQSHLYRNMKACRLKSYDLN